MQAKTNLSCNVDAYLQRSTITAYFYRQHFVGYSTSIVMRPARPNPNAATAKGLRVGDTLARAQRVYGTALRTSFAQRGSWFARTSQGTLDG
jgi:hypothetical protein